MFATRYLGLLGDLGTSAHLVRHRWSFRGQGAAAAEWFCKLSASTCAALPAALRPLSGGMGRPNPGCTSLQRGRNAWSQMFGMWALEKVALNWYVMISNHRIYMNLSNRYQIPIYKDYKSKTSWRCEASQPIGYPMRVNQVFFWLKIKTLNQHPLHELTISYV